MEAPFLWLVVYVLGGTVALWLCHNTSVCRMHARAVRNNRIVSSLRSLTAVKPKPDPMPTRARSDREVVAG